MKKIKVLHVIPSLGKGGAERLLIDICNELKKNENIECKIICFSPVNEYLNISSDLDISYCDASVKLSFFGKAQVNIDAYSAAVDKFKPDIIHSHLYIAEIISREYTSENIVYVTHLHSYETQLEKFSYKTIFSKRKLTNFYEKKWLINKYSKCNNYFIAISKYIRDYFLEVMPKKLNKLVLIPNAIDYKKFFCNNIHVISDTINIVTTGSLVRNKNHIFLVDVMRYITNKNIKAELYILGDGPEKDKIKGYIEKHSMTDNIFLKGKIDNVDIFLHKATLYVHASNYEAFGLALLEAMAAGLPVICLDGKGNRDIIKDGYNGFMIYKNNTELFAEKIIQLISSPELYNKISENAVKFAAEYDIEKYTENLVKFYNIILSEKRAFIDVNLHPTEIK